MSDYREIRVRLNLEHPQDRWLASALEERTRELGAPLARVVRRALTAYLHDNTSRQFDDVSSGAPREGSRTEPKLALSQNTGARETPLTATRPGLPPTDPLRLGSEADADIVGALASMGAPPEHPDPQ